MIDPAPRWSDAAMIRDKLLAALVVTGSGSTDDGPDYWTFSTSIY
ncbi:MAG TPA: hypothetical protein VGL29_16410 [Blastocatellia bacterium]